MGQRIAINAGVSTTDQSCSRQIAELTAFAGRSLYEIEGVFAETGSGTKTGLAARRRVMALVQAVELTLS